MAVFSDEANPVIGDPSPAWVSRSLLLSCNADSRILLGDGCTMPPRFPPLGSSTWISSISAQVLCLGASNPSILLNSRLSSNLPVSLISVLDSDRDGEARDDLLDLTVANSLCKSLMASAIFFISSLCLDDVEVADRRESEWRVLSDLVGDSEGWSSLP